MQTQKSNQFEKDKYFVEYNDKIRLKITDKCNLSCPFCHCEGTRKTEGISLSDKNLLRWLREFKPFYKKVHLTGGEPTLYKNLPALCKYLKSEGYEVFLTTNLVTLNENFLAAIPDISRVNVSLHTFNPSYFKNFIGNEEKAANALNAIEANIHRLNSMTEMAINTVVSNDESQDLEHVLRFCQENEILLKLVPDWRYLKESKQYIKDFLRAQGFIAKKRTLKMPGSNLRIFFERDNYHVEYKDIKPFYLDFWCKDCEAKEDCIESHAFLRLEGNPLRFKICIDKLAMNCEQFEEYFWPQFRKLLGEYRKQINNHYEIK